LGVARHDGAAILFGQDRDKVVPRGRQPMATMKRRLAPPIHAENSGPKMPPVLLQLRDELRAVADPVKAPQMQAYMKSGMPYHGVPLPLLRKTFNRVFRTLELGTSGIWRDYVLELWRHAEYREERYGALFLAGDRRAQAFQTPAAMNMYEEMIVAGAWWDYVDDIAIHRVGPILASHPVPLKKKMLSWSKSTNVWKRRTAIICQIQLKDRVDLGLLYACIEPSLGSQEFFLRKAIGWALRQVAWTEPDEVLRYVRANRDRLSPLSRREALKNVADCE
jgi:3-methyladenine DNA glycosylase AlkD